MPTPTSTLKSIQYSAGFVLCILLGTLTSHLAVAASPVGKIIFTVGDVYMLAANGSRAATLQHGDNVSVADTFATGADGYAHIRMSDNAFIALRPDSILRIDEYSFTANKKELDRVKISLLKGKLRSVSGKVAKRSKNRYRLNTPVAAIGVRGTDYTVITTSEQSQVDVLQGGIAMSPFNAACKVSALGPCQGDSVVDLYAEMNQHYLQLNARSQAPDLIEGRLLNMSRPEDNNSLQQIKPSQVVNQAAISPASSEQEAKQNTDSNPQPTDTDSAEAPVTEAAATETQSNDAELQPAAEVDNDNADTHSEDASSSHVDDQTVDSHNTEPASNQQTKPDTVTDESIRETLDADNDGVADFIDVFPYDPAEQLDSDQDGIGNNQDPDDDNDGLTDSQELLSGSNPLSSDTDEDGVIDSEDSRPLSSAGVRLQSLNSTVNLPETEFSALVIHKVSLHQLEGKHISGNIRERTMELQTATPDSSDAPYLTLNRRIDSTGKIFWGDAGTARAWDHKYRENLLRYNATPPGTPNTASPPTKDDRWNAYYQADNFTPLVENDSLYLSNVNGLVPITPDLNSSFSKQGLLYDLSASEIKLIDNQGNAQQVSVVDFDFKMNYKNQTFRAELIATSSTNSRIAIRFDGALNKSGMVFGGNADAYLKGFFINQMRQIALIFEAQNNGQTYSGTLVVDRNYDTTWNGKLEKTFGRYQTANNAPVTWGRWSNFSEITNTDDFAHQMQGDQLIAHNRVFALMRTANEAVSLPTDGVFSFEMNAAEAVYKRGEYTETASITNPSLTVNFNDRTFTTALRVAAPSISNGIDISAGGSVQDDGLFFSNPSHSNSTVSGAVHNNGMGASIIFERELEQGSYVSGAVDWAR